MICSPTVEAVRHERRRVLAIIEACTNSTREFRSDTRIAEGMLKLAAKLIRDGQDPDEWDQPERSQLDR